jgi:hypothetical protein
MIFYSLQGLTDMNSMLGMEIGSIVFIGAAALADLTAV